VVKPVAVERPKPEVTALDLASRALVKTAEEETELERDCVVLAAMNQVN